MDEKSTEKIAILILEKSGLIKNRADLIHIIENELLIIYSELDSSKIPESNSDDPVIYYEPVVSIIDLVAGGQIYTPFYKLITIEERSFIRKITNGQDFYINVERGKGRNFFQNWTFEYFFDKKVLNFTNDISLRFSFEVGVRDPYPFKIYGKNINQETYTKLENYVINI